MPLMPNSADYSLKPSDIPRILLLMNTQQFYIDGAWVDPIEGTGTDVINPSTETVCARISLGGEADTQAAVAAAKRAFYSWSLSSKAERLELMNRILEVYLSRSDEVGETISREMGAPMDMAAISQAGSGSYHIEAFIRALEVFEFERELRPDTSSDRILYEPIGVCGLITPWNWPMNQIALKVMPAIATGCTMVLKPSELSPLSAMVFADILHEAGVPAGVFNLVNGDGAGVGTTLSGHPDIALISFTGSSRAGIAISKNAADSLKRVSLELGGQRCQYRICRCTRRCGCQRRCPMFQQHGAVLQRANQNASGTITL